MCTVCVQSNIDWQDSWKGIEGFGHQYVASMCRAVLKAAEHDQVHVLYFDPGVRSHVVDCDIIGLWS